MTVSAVICTRGRPQLLHDTVTSLLAGTRLPDELVIVDQSDEPDAAIQALGDGGRCPIRYLHDAGRGSSRARNLAIARATGDVLCFTDDDMLLDAGWLAALLAALEAAPPRTVVTGRVPAVAAAGPGFAPSTIDDPEPAVHVAGSERDVLYAGNMAARRAALAEVGPFDERLGPGVAYPAAEDNDYGLRVLMAGYEIRYAPDAIANHRAWRPPGALVGLRRAYGRGQGAFYAKHARHAGGYGLRRARRDLVRYAGRAVRHAARRPLRATAGDLAYCGAMLRGMASWWVRAR